MNNALRTLALSAALGACETREPLAQAADICVRHVDATDQLANDRTYPGAHPHAETESIRNVVAGRIASTADEHGVGVCGDNDSRKQVTVHTTIEGAYGVTFQPIDEQVSNNSDLSVSAPISADRLIHLGTDGLTHGCDYSWLSASNYRNGYDFTNAVGDSLSRTLDCTLNSQYHWKW